MTSRKWISHVLILTTQAVCIATRPSNLHGTAPDVSMGRGRTHIAHMVGSYKCTLNPHVCNSSCRYIPSIGYAIHGITCSMIYHNYICKDEYRCPHECDRKTRKRLWPPLVILLYRLPHMWMLFTMCSDTNLTRVSVCIAPRLLGNCHIPIYILLETSCDVGAESVSSCRSFTFIQWKFIHT